MEALKYRENDYFNSEGTFLFENSLGQQFESKVHKDEDKPHWFTSEPARPSYKATSLPCVNALNKIIKMAIIVKWKNLALTPQEKQLELPDHATQIHTEFGGWTSDRDIYLWGKEYGNDKCKKIVSTRWKSNLSQIKIEINQKGESL